MTGGESKLIKELEPLPFRFSGKVARLLGRESVSNAIVAVSELVKNSYDADASKVEIIFENVTADNGRIRILDNGVGMTYEDFKTRWMVVGTESKERAPKSPSGKRRVVGEKGIGRFAVERLAEKATLVSNPKNDNETITMYIDWSRYEEKDALFDQIKNRVTASPKSDKNYHGFEIILEGLRDTWDEKAVQELEKHLSVLVPPKQLSDFEIRVYAPEYKKYGLRIESTLLKEAMYELKCSLSGRRIHYVIKKGGKLVHDDGIQTDNIECGQVRFTMYFFPLDRGDEKWNYKVFKRREVTEMLKEFAGIKIYRDGFRVKPYGDPDDDWLGLNLKRLQRFGSKIPSNNQIIGFVEISRDENRNLIDTTTREGLIHNIAFHHMTDFLEKSISAFALYRKKEEKEKKDVTPQFEISENISRLKKIVESAELPKTERKVAQQIITDVESRMHQVEQESISTMQAYRNLAALGITVSSVSHEIASPISIIMHTASGLIEGLRNHAIQEDELISGLQVIRSNILKIEEFIQFILGFASATSKKKVNLNFQEVFNGVLNPFKSVFEKRGIKVIANINPNLPPLYMNRAELDSILINLVTNSLYFLRETKEPLVKITARCDVDGFRITYSDNGKGVPSENRKIIFQPFFTTKKDGVGLGLTIVAEIVEDYGGTIEVMDSEFDSGATFNILLPKSVVGAGAK